MHGIAHRLIAEVIDELGIRENTIGVAPVGCSVFCYNYFEVDFVEAAHGRAPAMATGLKRVLPDKIVFTYQGDGDLASIGLAEIMHAALRGENITVIFINNAIYGMTGGQMAPTTLPGMKTTSSPMGRDVETAGLPDQDLRIAGHDGRRNLHRAAQPAQPHRDPQGQEGHQAGVRESDSRLRLLAGRVVVELPHQLGYSACRSVEVDRDADGAGVSVGRL